MGTFMRLSIKRIFCLLFIFLLLFALFDLVCAEVLSPREPLPLLEEYNVFWGDWPQRLRRQCELIEKDKNAADTGCTAYSYKMEVLENDAKVTCFYSRLLGLREADIIWSFDDHIERDIVLKRIKEKLENVYGLNEFYFFEENINEMGERTIRLGLDNGVTGIFYYIQTLDTKLIVVCILNM